MRQSSGCPSTGGSGSPLNAGYPADDEPEDRFIRCETEEEEAQEEPEDSPFVKEIRLHGTGRSSWGNFKVIGRVRAWDGLILLTKEHIVSLWSPFYFRHRFTCLCMPGG